MAMKYYKFIIITILTFCCIQPISVLKAQTFDWT